MTRSPLVWTLFASAALVGVGCDRSPTSTAQSAEPAPAATAQSPAVAAPIVETTFDDIKFEMEKTDRFRKEMLTPKIEQLLGKRIRIRGYIFPTLKKRGLKQFVLVRDNLQCCFGPGAALYDCILVTMQPEKTAAYSVRPVTVEGTFRFEQLLGPDGRHMAVYQLDGESVQ